MQKNKMFTEEWLISHFPKEKTEDFFEALFGGTEEGAYDISLQYEGSEQNVHHFAFYLTQRPGKCLACNLTYGLPQVFSRHPVIGAAKIAESVAAALGGTLGEWKIAATKELSREIHALPFQITVLG